MQKATPTTSTGMAENVESLLCYVAWWVTGIIFLVIEKNSQLVRFHALQSIIFFGGISVINFILAIIPIIGWIIAIILWIIGIIFWITSMLRAYRGEKFKLPIAGKLAENWMPKVQPPQA